MKNRKYILVSGFLILAGVIAMSFFKDDLFQTGSLQKPLIHAENKEELEKEKNRSWTTEEAEEYATNFELVRQSIEEGKALQRTALIDVNSLGTWTNRGPYNMPGAFQFCEMDEGTDTVYAVTCGHYGGAQFIWKGTLKGDNWTMITPHNPSRFEDLIVIPNGNLCRVIASHQMGRIMYSDNGGKTWNNSTGIAGGIYSTIVNRQDNYTLYATDGKTVFRSMDKGTSFSVFQSVGTTAYQARLYSPRWSIQPGAVNVYLAIGAKFFKLNTNKTSFIQTGTLPTASGSGGVICLGGDTRKLWMTLGRRKWHYSMDDGVNWTYQHTTNTYYSTLEDDMIVGQYPGVNPENPNVLIGGYTGPLSTRDGGANTNIDAQQYWGYYQNAVGNDPKVRNNYHPDFQAHQFFYDKTGKLLTLRSSDGGVFLSYNDWTKTSFPAYSDMTGVYYNISLFDKPSQETYRGGFLYGIKSLYHLATGTQDQGWQRTRANTTGTGMFSWDQVGGGDGPCCITGDGIIGWKYDYFGSKNFTRIQLYNGTTFSGLGGTASSPVNFTFTGGYYFTPSVGDWSDGNRIWVLSQTLRRIEYNTSNSQITGLEKNLTGTSHYIQGIAQSRKTPTLLYALQNGIVFKSTDRGTNWSQLAGQSVTGMTGSNQNKGMGWSSPLDEKIVLFASQSGTSVKTIYSKDGGITWKNVTGSGANLFPAAEVNGMAGTSDGNFVFASTNMGPYVFVVAEEKWYPMATNPDVPLFAGQIVYCQKYNGKEFVRFSTWGQGIWDFEISTTITGINDNLTKKVQEIKVYPNPVTAFATIAGLTIGDKISIHDLSGKEILNLTATQQEEVITTSHFESGIYIVKISGKPSLKFFKIE